MSADRETNHGMTSHDMSNRDIAFLLADAADEVEIGIAPYDAVLRGGRRRRARRWAVATATALALVGSAGTLAVAGLPGGDGSRGAQVATQVPAPPVQNVYPPERTTLATGTVDGEDWWVTIDVWSAPRDAGQARAQWEAMAAYGSRPVDKASDLIGKSAYFVNRTYGDGETGGVSLGVFDENTPDSGKDLQSVAIPLDPKADGGPKRLVIGQIAPTAQQVTCTWKNGTTTEVHKVPENEILATDIPAIRPASQSPVNWFVCVAPEGTEYKSAGVTK
ncbi:hypothetical protein [Streptomyces sp. AS02]|uniref:hypothetical protein n=1 Tax=Streptomyces sp. AS02 TaxID=2938946 RepID=UPI0020217BB2|nr:hypothetical protein [Streptomyces sp. AS02]MCL8010297.1 hypothetical protein [Streptomyces sp. AS02]